LNRLPALEHLPSELNRIEADNQTIALPDRYLTLHYKKICKKYKLDIKKAQVASLPWGGRD
jgi:hypothetical protein